MRLKAACVMLLVAVFVFPATVYAQRGAASKARGEYGRSGGSAFVGRSRSVAPPAARSVAPAPITAPDASIARTPGQGRVYSYQPGTTTAPTRVYQYRPGYYRSGNWCCPPGTVVRPQR